MFHFKIVVRTPFAFVGWGQMKTFFL